MTSPALRRRQKNLALNAAAGRAETADGQERKPSLRATVAALDLPEGPARTEQAALLAVLHENIRALSDIASHEQRQPKKAEYALTFRPWIDGLLDADAPVQDEVLVTNMIWAIDYRDFDYALRLARFVIGHGLTLPERYNRTPACFVAEEIAELALSQHEDVPHETLLAVEQLVDGNDMPDQVSAKLKKATGRSWYRRAEAFDPAGENAVAGGGRAYAEAALADLQRALTLDANAGVKKDIQRAETLVRKLTAEQAPAS